MKLLLIGSGGREHALAWALAREAEVFCTPGNPGIGGVAERFVVQASDTPGIVSLAKHLGVDAVIVGPEAPLIAGLADALRSSGVRVFGPGASGARLEASKAFSKDLMRASNVPTAAFGVFTEVGLAKQFASSLMDAGGGVAIKASGEALGKGVVVCQTQQEADEALDAMLVDGVLGESGRTVVVERRLVGREFSLLTICSDGHTCSLPVAQDYKRALDGDRGPNTGGMGTYSPVSWVGADLVAEAEASIVQPILAELSNRGIEFRGMLFSGIMVEDGRPYCLEYNVRFGDPETQSIVRRLGSGFAGALLDAANGQPIRPIEVLDHAAVTVVVASGGYPGEYRKNLPIQIGPLAEDTIVFHAGTTLLEGVLSTSGGRVMSVSATGSNLSEARERAYRSAAAVQFDNAYYRHDIAQDVT